MSLDLDPKPNSNPDPDPNPNPNPNPDTAPVPDPKPLLSLSFYKVDIVFIALLEMGQPGAATQDRPALAVICTWSWTEGKDLICFGHPVPAGRSWGLLLQPRAVLGDVAAASGRV